MRPPRPAFAEHGTDQAALLPVVGNLPSAGSTTETSVQKKLANFEAFQASLASLGSVAANRPLQLFLEVTSACNLRCAKCALTYDPKLNRGQTVPFSVFSELSEFFEAAVEVQTFGFGEMFLYPDLGRLVALLKHHACRVAGVTNGTQIREADVRWLVAHRYDELTFSIDAAAPETMKRLRGADLESILHVLELIDALKCAEGSPFPRLVVNFVAQADNYQELPDLVRLLAPLHVFFLGVNPLHHFYGSNGEYGDYYERHCLAHVRRDDFEAMVAEAGRLAQDAGIAFANYVRADFEWRSKGATPTSSAASSLSGAAHGPVESLPPLYCMYPWTTLYLAANRTAKVCCFMSQHENLGTYSNISSVGDVWNGPRLREVRDAIQNGRVHPACRECVNHRTYESHGAVMTAIRRTLGDITGDRSA